MPATESLGRRSAIPVLFTRGTHYEVGFDVGRTFSGLIHSFLDTSDELNKVFLPLYQTPEGKKIYDETLASVRENFPQYVREIEGIADGAKVPFHKLFLLHMDDVLPTAAGYKSTDNPAVGCSTICCNQPGQEVLGHTEDVLSDVMNHIYFVSAHIISDSPQGRWKITEEHFTSLCYAGHLPGFTMSYNHHGLVFSVNIISAKNCVSGKTPRYFLTRALLAAENFVQAQQILRDSGCGAANAVSINMTFLNQEGDRLFHNAEVGPAANGAKESALSVLTASPGEHIYHCNKFLRLKMPETGGMIIASSDKRLSTLNNYPDPLNKDDVTKMLGDTSHPEFNVFQDLPGAPVKTVAVGIFDCVGRTWSIYADNPAKNNPVVVLPLFLKATTK